METYADSVLTVLGVAAAAATAMFFVFRVVPAWRVLRRSLYPPRRRFAGLRVLVPLGDAAWRVAIGDILQSDIFYRAARVWIEFSLFRPPEPEGPPTERSRRELQTWYNRRAQAFQHLAGARSDALPAIPVHTLWDIQTESKAAEISRYLDALDRAPVDRFLCSVQIGTAFIAPLHLLTGLLTRYEKDWERVIADFTVSTDDDPDDGLTGDMRYLQAFIFDCWLLWGPSIPLCTCRLWHSGRTGIALQLGYGDEGNSLPVFSEGSLLLDEMEKLLAAPASPAGPPALARPVSITGKIRWGGPLIDDVERERICEAQRDALAPTAAGEGEAAPPIFLEYSASLAVGGDRNYYSAYLWVMFVVLDERGKPLFDPRQPEYWRGVIPFFEHGNIADGYTLTFLKGQLARKVIGGLAELLDKAPRAQFAYACAVDHSGCGAPLKFADKLPGHEKGILEALRRELDDPRHAASKSSGRLHLDPTRLGVKYSSCHLPEMIADYYRGVDARRRRA